MKNTHGFISSLVLAFIIFSAPYLSAQIKWINVLKAQNRISVIYFYSSNLGFVGVGVPSGTTVTPIIYRTEDGGKSWSVSKTPSVVGYGVNDIFMENENTGWAGSDNRNGRIWKTIDGGKSWNPQSPNINGDHLTNSIRITSQGMILSDFYGDDIELSTDSGKNFHQVYTPGNDYVLGMDFIDSLHGAVVTTFRSGNHWSYTSDGGLTWYPSNFGIECWTLRAMKGTSTFFAIPEGPSDINTYLSDVMRSDDYGMSWKKIRTLPFRSTSDVEISGNDLYIQTSHGGCIQCDYPDGSGIYRSTDSGMTWHGIGGPDYWNDTRFAVVITCEGTLIFCSDINNNVFKVLDTVTSFINTSDGILHSRITLPDSIDMNICQIGSAKARISIDECYKLVITSESTEGKDSQYFSLSHSALPETLSGSEDSIQIYFHSQDSGFYQAYLHIRGYYDYIQAGLVPFDTLIPLHAKVKPPLSRLEPDKYTVVFNISPCASHYDAMLTLINKGCDTLVVDSGPGNVAPFDFDSIQYPVVLPPNGTKTFNIHFSTDSVMTDTAWAVFHAHSHYEEIAKVITLIAKLDDKTQSHLEPDKSTVLFNISPCTSHYEATLSLMNKGCDTIVIDSGPGNVVPFVFDSIHYPVVLPPNGTKAFYIHFSTDSVMTDSVWAVFHAHSRQEGMAQVIALIAKYDDKATQLSTSSQMLDFQSIMLCDGPKKLRFQLSNPSCDTIRINSNNSLSSEFILDPVSYPITIPPKESVSIGVTFQAKLPGNYFDTLKFQIENSRNKGMTSLALVGNAQANPPQLSPKNEEINFRSVSTCANQADSFTILKNTGCDTLQIISGPGNLPKEFTVNKFSYPVTLIPGDSVILQASFHPSGSGSYSKILNFISERFGVQSTVEVTLTGEGIQGLGILQSSPQSFAFNPADICTPTDSLEGIIQNTGCDSLVIDTVSLSENPAFTLSSLSLPACIAPGDTIHYKIYSSYRSKGEYQSDLLIGAYSAHEIKTRYRSVIPVSASVGDGLRLFSIDRSQINFGAHTICDEPDASVTILNTGCDTISISSAAITGSGYFLLDISFPMIICPGKSVKISVISIADTTGRKQASQATLSFASNTEYPISPILLQRENVYPLLHQITLGAISKNGSPGDTIQLQIIAGDDLQGVQSLDLDLECNTDLLSYLQSSGPNTTSFENGHLQITGNPNIISDNGILTTLAFQVFLANEPATDIRLSHPQLNVSDPSFEQCIATAEVIDNSTRFISNYSCGEQIIAAKMNDIMPLCIKALYPNPAQNTITIDLNSHTFQEAMLILFDALGNEIYHKSLTFSAADKSEIVDISSLPSGMYLARLVSGNTATRVNSVPFIKKE